MSIPTNFKAFNYVFLPSVTHENQDNDEISIHRSVLSKWIEEYHYPEGQSLLVNVTNHLTNISRVCCLGAPHVESQENVYLPNWIVNNLGLSEYSDNNETNWVTIEPFLEEIPSATKIYLKPLDNAIYHIDIRECFEKALDKFHVLEKGSMLYVNIESLGGYEVCAYVDNTEPADIVRIGGEVGVEFLEPDNGIPEFAPPPIPAPSTSPENISSNTIEEPKILHSETDYKKIQNEVRASWLKKFGKEKESK